MGRHRWLALLLTLAVLPGPARAQVKLRWKFKEGDTFYVEEKVSTRQTVKVRGSAQVQQLEQTRVSRFKVLKAAADGGAVLEQKIESVKVTPYGAGIKADASSVRRMEGATFQITLDARQRVTRFEGYKKLIDALAKDNEDVAKVFRAVLTEQAVRRPVEALLGFTPEKPVARGQSWQVKSDVPFGPLGTLHLVDTYTLQAEEQVEKDVVKVTVSSAATYSAPEGPAGGNFPFKVISGDVKVKEAKGSLLFNVATGRLVQREVQRVLRGVFTLAASEQTRIEEEVEQRQSSAARVLDNNPLQK
jgi:hypothetical protein